MALLSGMYTLMCDIVRQGFTSDGQGSFVPSGTPTTLATDVSCLITMRGERELMHQGGRTNLGTHAAHLEYRQPVNLQKGDVLTNVRRKANPLDIQMDAVTNMGGQVQQVQRQYRVASVTDPDGLHDHVEVGLDVIEARAMP